VLASGGDGSVRIYDDAWKLVGTVGALEDADNVRYDAESSLLYVGYGQGALAVIYPDKVAKVAEIRLDGHPESFQLEVKGKRIFVNVPTAGEIEVIDRETRSLVDKWKLSGADATSQWRWTRPTIACSSAVASHPRWSYSTRDQGSSSPVYMGAAIPMICSTTRPTSGCFCQAARAASASSTKPIPTAISNFPP
jgi:hypothetical protein